MADEDPVQSSAVNGNDADDGPDAGLNADSDANADTGADGVTGAGGEPDDDASDPSDDLTDPADALTDPADNVPPAKAPDVGVDVPDVPDPEEVPEGLRAEFWEIVLAFNVALFALALGTLIVVFEGDATTGGASLVVGTLALAYGFWQYRTREHAP